MGVVRKLHSAKAKNLRQRPEANRGISPNVGHIIIKIKSYKWTVCIGATHDENAAGLEGQKSRLKKGSKRFARQMLIKIQRDYRIDRSGFATLGKVRNRVGVDDPWIEGLRHLTFCFGKVATYDIGESVLAEPALENSRSGCGLVNQGFLIRGEEGKDATIIYPGFKICGVANRRSGNKTACGRLIFVITGSVHEMFFQKSKE